MSRVLFCAERPLIEARHNIRQYPEESTRHVYGPRKHLQDKERGKHGQTNLCVDVNGSVCNDKYDGVQKAQCVIVDDELYSWISVIKGDVWWYEEFLMIKLQLF